MGKRPVTITFTPAEARALYDLVEVGGLVMLQDAASLREYFGRERGAAAAVMAQAKLFNAIAKARAWSRRSQMPRGIVADFMERELGSDG